MLSATREYLKTILLLKSFSIIFYNKPKFILATRLLIYIRALYEPNCDNNI